MPDTPPTVDAELKRWRQWAQFVYLGGGPVVLTDAELRDGVCNAHSQEVYDLQRTGNWQPIITAPKDEMLIVSNELWPAVAATWDPRFGLWATVPHGHAIEPTHWRPLPAK